MEMRDRDTDGEAYDADYGLQAYEPMAKTIVRTADHVSLIGDMRVGDVQTILADEAELDNARIAPMDGQPFEYGFHLPQPHPDLALPGDEDLEMERRRQAAIDQVIDRNARKRAQIKDPAELAAFEKQHNDTVQSLTACGGDDRGFIEPETEHDPMPMPADGFKIERLGRRRKRSIRQSNCGL
jgi:hypothetical protein